jgi:hypothetical protein
VLLTRHRPHSLAGGMLLVRQCECLFEPIYVGFGVLPSRFSPAACPDGTEPDDTFLWACISGGILREYWSAVRREAALT